jgi:hypothetical protein
MTRTWLSAMTISASNNEPAAAPNFLKEVPESAALHEAGDDDRRAPAAPHEAAGLARDFFINVGPDRAGADLDGRLGRYPAGAVSWYKSVAKDDLVHTPRPDQQGIRRAGGPWKLWPPPLITSCRLRSRAKFTAATTSAALSAATA